MASLEGMNGERELDNPNDVDYNRRTFVMILMIMVSGHLEVLNYRSKLYSLDNYHWHHWTPLRTPGFAVFPNCALLIP